MEAWKNTVGKDVIERKREEADVSTTERRRKGRKGISKIIWYCTTGYVLVVVGSIEARTTLHTMYQY